MYKKTLVYLTIIFFSLLVLWDRVLYERFLALDLFFNYSAEITSLEDFYDPIKKQYGGEKNSVSTFSYKAVAQTDSTVTIKNTFDVKTVYSEPIFSVKRLYEVDKISQEHSKGGDRDRDGYLFAPRNLKKGQPFTYWHVNYDGPAHMEFVKEENINGLVVYRYESSYPGVVIDQTQDLAHLPGVPEERGVRLDPKLTLWIEPVSGWMVHYQDQTTAYYYDVITKKTIEPWNSFRNFYTQNSINQQVLYAKNLRSTILLLHFGIPVLLVVAWFVCLLIFTYGKSFASSFLIKSIVLFLLIFLMISLTLGAWWYTRLQGSQIYGFTVELNKQEIQDRIFDRMSVYTNALIGIKGLFNASEEVTRAEWREYASTINLQKQYPGVQGLGYAKIIDKAEIPAVESQVQKEGYPQFSVFPKGEREKYSTIIYLEPLDDRNLLAFGYDMFSEKVRERAMNLADETLQPTISGKVTLLQENENDNLPGFLMYLPVLKDEKVVGYVYSPFRMYDLMEKMFNTQELENISFRIYDANVSDTISEETLLFDSQKITDYSHSGDIKQYKNLGQSYVYLFNTKWIIEFFVTQQSPLYTNDTQVSNLILLFGGIITFLLLLFFVLFMSSQFNAQRQVKNIFHDFEDKKTKFTELLENLTIENRRFLIAQKISKIGGFEESYNTGTVFWSKQLFEILGSLKHQNPLRLSEYSNIVSPEYKDKMSIFITQLKKADKTMKIVVPLQNKNKWIEIKAFTIFEAEKPIKIFGTIQDITEQKNTEITQTKFMSFVLEKFTQPLVKVSSLLNTLLSGKVDNLDEQQYATVIEVETASDSMIETASRITSIARLESGNLAVDMKLCQPRELVKSVVSNLSKQAKEKSIGVSVEISDTVSPFVSDNQLIGEVISILLSNSIKFSPHLANITVKVNATVDSIIFSITDTGQGISDAVKGVIFERFSEEKLLQMNPSGTGLSLYYAKKVVEVLGGDIEFQSMVGKGTTATISFPKKTV
ncbi:CHASE domain-containing protein [Candidatus Woesebacteria bacterium]|nr:CHASE domain-containing protein [Candidatus Woesebacteria bacterium]